MLAQGALPRPLSTIHTQTYGVNILETTMDEVGNAYIFLKGVASLVLGNLVTYDETGATTLLTKTEADKLKPMAVALAAAVAGNFGWFQIFGEVAALTVKASATKEGALYSTATAGFVDITATSQTKINRAILRANRAASDGVTTAYIAYPSAA